MKKETIRKMVTGLGFLLSWSIALLWTYQTGGYIETTWDYLSMLLYPIGLIWLIGRMYGSFRIFGW